jgi:hypothetical protein
MDPKERDQQLDKWLDNALANYSDAEPQWGFEQRLRTNVLAEKPRRRSIKFLIPALAAVAIALVIAVLLTTPEAHKHPTPKQTPTVSSTARPGTIAPPPAQRTPRLKLEARRAAPKVRVPTRTKESVEQQYPRQAVFPAPTPMTAEERALMAMVKRAPQEAEKVASAKQEHPEAPQKLTIQAINIEPLEAAGFGGGRK